MAPSKEDTVLLADIFYNLCFKKISDNDTKGNPLIFYLSNLLMFSKINPFNR